MGKYMNLVLTKSCINFDSETSLDIQIKFDDDGVIIDVWDGDSVISSTWETYAELQIDNPNKRKKRKSKSVT